MTGGPFCADLLQKGRFGVDSLCTQVQHIPYMAECSYFIEAHFAALKEKPNTPHKCACLP